MTTERNATPKLEWTDVTSKCSQCGRDITANVRTIGTKRIECFEWFHTHNHSARCDD